MDWIQPMEPIYSDTIATGEEWIYQIKWDGIRGLTYFNRSTDKEQVRIFTKKGRQRTEFYPELHPINDMITGDSAVLDGELVVLGEDSKPSFHSSLIRERVSNPDRLPYYIKNYPVIYIIFDILYYNGRLLTALPLWERQGILRDCLKTDSNIAIAQSYMDGPGLFDVMKKKNWEGIISKKRSSLYHPAKKHRDWFKHKTLKKMLAAVCGVQWKNEFPNSLILGILQESNWIFIGKASSGLTQDDWQQIMEYALKHKVQVPPFKETGQFKRQQVTWLNPLLTCWIRFLEWTNEGVLRNPTILGFSDSPVEQAAGKEWSINE
ncbi:MAG: ATP-dependent DNA ligase [Caldicoprobacterales bacterium]|jgi:bifunctional non-homologous end joining protein LigD|nr:ATP-dependent DNA ligase [Clostridiales bacterium]